MPANHGHPSPPFPPAALAARRERPDGSGGGEEAPQPLPANQFPNSTHPATGLYQGSKAAKWTSGYLAGCYWRAFNLTGDPKWAELAKAELPGLDQVAGETDVSVEAAGPSFVAAAWACALRRHALALGGSRAVRECGAPSC